MALLTGAPLQANLPSHSQQDREVNSTGSATSTRYSQDSKHGQQGPGRGWSRGRGRSNGRSWSRSRPQCQLCGKIGRMVQTCYHRFDKTFSGVSPGHSVQVNYHQLHNHGFSSFSAVCSSVPHCCGSFSPSASASCQSSSRGSVFSPPDQTWYPDSGATNHITPDMSTLTTTSPYTGTSTVSMGNGDNVPIASVGSSTLLVGSRLLHLRSVLHVPTVCKNLVGQFARDNAVYFEFHPFLCFVKDIQPKRILLVGHIQDGLYRFDVSRADLAPTSKPSNETIAAQITSTALLHNAQLTSSPMLWHNRLGHPCNNTLVHVLRTCTIRFTRNSLPHVCSACQLGKAHKLPFSHSDTMYSLPFELIVSDVWGPAHVSSNGFSYYVSFIDMHNRYTWIYFLKTKSEFFSLFSSFFSNGPSSIWMLY